MSVQCDVCGAKVTPGVRFCPGCGLEIIEDRERPGRAPLTSQPDVFDWSDDAADKEYAIAERQQAQIGLERLRAMLKEAQARLTGGRVREAAAMLRKVQPHLTEHASLRPVCDRLHQEVVARKRALRQRAEAMVKRLEVEQLRALLSGPAANELEPEEIASIAIQAAQSLHAARRAEEANDLLHLGVFRTLRDERLIDEHRELDALVQQQRRRQHWLKSVAILGGVILAAGAALFLFAWLLWRVELGRLSWVVLLLALVAIAFLSFLPRIRALLEKKLGQSTEERTFGSWVFEAWQKWRRLR